MGERQISWRRVAKRYSGDFEATTGIRTSGFRLSAIVSGTSVEVRGNSIPYAPTGGTTEISARSRAALNAVVYLGREAAPLGPWRRWFYRDVRIGDSRFDRDWIINAKREAHAQAFLGPGVRTRIQAIPPATYELPYSTNTTSTYYDFDIRGRDVLARSANFESSEERLVAAIESAVALVQQPEHLLSAWRTLAADLDGRLEFHARWRMDGSTRVRFPIRGVPVSVSPIMVRVGRRRDRLRTRVSCERSGTRAARSFRILAGESTADFGDDADILAAAMSDSGAVLLHGDRAAVHADLDGNVTEPTRIAAAASAVAILARKSAHAGPYR